MKAKLTLTKQERLDILTNAIESNGIQYWTCEYDRIKIKRDSDLNIIQAEFDADNENGEKTHYVVTHATIQKGIDAILSGDLEISDYIVNGILTQDNDSDTDDCIIQAALFGELVYG